MTSYRAIFLMFAFFLFFIFGRTVFKKHHSPVATTAEEVVQSTPTKPESASSVATKSTFTEATAGKSVVTHKPVRDVVRSAQGQYLFEKLFDDSYFKEKPVQAFLPALESRFINDIDAPSEKEEIAKMGILKALAKDKSLQSVSSADRAALVQFYQTALQKLSTNKSYPMVQTQLIRNLKTWITSLDEKSRKEFTSKVDPRWMLLASRSEREIAEDLFATSK